MFSYSLISHSTFWDAKGFREQEQLTRRTFYVAKSSLKANRFDVDRLKRAAFLPIAQGCSIPLRSTQHVQSERNHPKCCERNSDNPIDLCLIHVALIRSSN